MIADSELIGRARAVFAALLPSGWCVDVSAEHRLSDGGFDAVVRVQPPGGAVETA